MIRNYYPWVIAIALAIGVITTVADAGNAGAATRTHVGLTFWISQKPPVSQIYPPNVVQFTIAVENLAPTAQSGAIVFPSWVRLGRRSNHHLIYDKAGELVWIIAAMEPGTTQHIKMPIIVTTAWDDSPCNMGDWHFDASLYTGFNGHLVGTEFACFGLKK